MLKNAAGFRSLNEKRKILIVDDEMINHAILGNILSPQYEVVYAADGNEALEVLRTQHELLSLVLLDLLMPGMNGMELLTRMKDAQEYQHIPVIVMTSEQSAEVESLRMGAIDFIPKPYNQPEVILARVYRIIELSEDRQIIQSTERDNLTGLYNREYFYRYAEQFDQRHRDLSMDAIVLDINHFRMVNERFGKACGDEMLRRIGEQVRALVRDSGGIVCRRGGDTFLIYCPHGKDYQQILDSASGVASTVRASTSRIRLRMGVYPQVDKSIDIERRFDRAKLAADSIRNNLAQAISFYDSALHESELFAEQLLDDFHEAIEKQQFCVYYQPIFDIRGSIPVLASAEALIRWQHPRLGMINPGVFVPLFEENGLIQQLDHYVWRQAAAQIRDWKARFGISVPVSVNVSRVDIYDPNLIDHFLNLMAEFDLTPQEYLLEITESAYTQDSTQMIETVNHLRALGFRIEMDDFGTGYSSLNMLSTLPIDALKLDMQFIRNVFNQGKDFRLLELIIDIADYLSVPVIAEGVETEEQLNALKTLGCDIVQGYYFSKPVPPELFQWFVEEKQQALHSPGEQMHIPDSGHSSAVNVAHALASGYEHIYYVDCQRGHYVEFSAKGKAEDLQIVRSGSDFFADARNNMKQLIDERDRHTVSAVINRNALLNLLEQDQQIILNYRLLVDGKPVDYSLKAVKATGKSPYHIVIGTSPLASLQADTNP